jgi:hypothetical protein
MIGFSQIKRPGGEGADADADSSSKDDTSELPAADEKVDVLAQYKKLLTFLKPGESVLRAIKRLG